MLIMDEDDDRVRETYGLGVGLLESGVAGLGEGGGSSSSNDGAISSPNSSVSGRGGGRSTIASRS